MGGELPNAGVHRIEDLQERAVAPPVAPRTRSATSTSEMIGLAGLAPAIARTRPRLDDGANVEPVCIGEQRLDVQHISPAHGL